MNAFWHLEQHPSTAVALLHGNRQIGYGELAHMADALAAQLPPRRTLGFLWMANVPAAVALYLGSLRSGRHVPLLMQSSMPVPLRDALVDHYRPDWMAVPPAAPAPAGYTALPAAPAESGVAIYVRSGPRPEPEPDARLALLLNTSGSTGSSKLVRLSADALAANAASIVEYLGLRADDRAITTLPLAYSFGMSILNSHLLAGGSVVLSNYAVVNREFWDLARESRITSLSGVPATFEMLRRIDFSRQGLGSLRMFTQAGGRLRDDLIRHFHKLAQDHGQSLFVMYGQTEAAPRISYVPPSRLANKVGSIGIAVPGGTLAVDPTSSELIYRGPNVMLGYAQQRTDLAVGDVQSGELHTGDLARVDEDGYVWLIGRIKRFIKISGSRVNLDAVEAMLSHEFGCAFACTGGDDNLVVFVTGESAADPEAVRQYIAQQYKLFLGHVQALPIKALPLLGSGKTDYRALKTLAQGENVA